MAAVRLRRRCADEQIVAEVMQETYLAVWRPAGFAGDSVQGTAVGRLWTIAARRPIDAFRRRARDAAVPLAAAVAAPAAEDEALGAVVGDDVGLALDRLAPELRQVLRAMVVDGLTVRETAVPPAQRARRRGHPAVRRRVRRALRLGGDHQDDHGADHRRRVVHRGAGAAAYYWEMPTTEGAAVRKAWRTFRALPESEQRARVAALRAAALDCDPAVDLLDILETP